MQCTSKEKAQETKQVYIGRINKKENQINAIQGLQVIIPISVPLDS